MSSTQLTTLVGRFVWPPGFPATRVVNSILVSCRLHPRLHGNGGCVVTGSGVADHAICSALQVKCGRYHGPCRQVKETNEDLYDVRRTTGLDIDVVNGIGSLISTPRPGEVRLHISSGTTYLLDVVRDIASNRGGSCSSLCGPLRSGEQDLCLNDYGISVLFRQAKEKFTACTPHVSPEPGQKERLRSTLTDSIKGQALCRSFPYSVCYVNIPLNYFLNTLRTYKTCSRNCCFEKHWVAWVKKKLGYLDQFTQNPANQLKRSIWITNCFYINKFNDSGIYRNDIFNNSKINSAFLPGAAIRVCTGGKRPRNSPISSVNRLLHRNFCSSNDHQRTLAAGMPASENDTVPDLKYHLSFAGCGFLGIYHLGVARTLVRHGGRFLSKVDKFTGASAGALVAATLATTDFDQDIMEDCNRFCYDLARDIRRRALGVLTPRVTLLGPLEEFLSTMLPADAHVRATERLCVSLTSANDKDNFIISDFKDKEDLIQCLLATSCIPLLTAQRPIMYRGQKFIDGGLTDNLPLLEGGRTILVSPFSGPQDICPVDKSGRKWQVHINNQDFKVNLLNIQRGLHAFFPPTQQVLQKYFQMGQIDAAKFLKRENMYERGPKEGGSLPRSPSRPSIINDDEETQTTDVISTSDIDTSKNVQYESTL